MHPLIDTQQETGDAVQGIHKVIDLIAVFFFFNITHQFDTTYTLTTHWVLEVTIYSIVLYQCCSIVSPHIVFGVGLAVWWRWCTIVILMQFKLQWFKSDTFAKEKKNVPNEPVWSVYL